MMETEKKILTEEELKNVTGGEVEPIIIVDKARIDILPCPENPEIRNVGAIH